jgi:hypothetical protein
MFCVLKCMRNVLQSSRTFQRNLSPEYSWLKSLSRRAQLHELVIPRWYASLDARLAHHKATTYTAELYKHIQTSMLQVGFEPHETSVQAGEDSSCLNLPPAAMQQALCLYICYSSVLGTSKKLFLKLSYQCLIITNN